MDDSLSQIEQLKQKIAVEKKLREGAEHLLKQLTDKNARQVCESNLAESSKRLNFLKAELNRVEKKDGGNKSDSDSDTGSITNDEMKGLWPKPASLDDSSGGNSAAPIESPIQRTGTASSKSIGSWFSHIKGRTASLLQHPSQANIMEACGETEPTTEFDYWKATTQLSSGKVQAKCHAIQVKMDVEQKVKTGTQKMSDAVVKTGDKRQAQEVALKLNDANNRVHLLGKALQRYEALNVGGKVQALKDEGASDSDAKVRKYSGKLIVNVGSIANLSSRGSQKSELYYIVRIDGHAKAQSKMNKTGKWSEDLEIVVENGVECEIAIYERSDSSGYLSSWMANKSSSQRSLRESNDYKSTDGRILALSWFKLSDLEDDLKTMKVSCAPPETPSATTPSPGSDQAPSLAGSLAQTCILDLEPAGQAMVKLALVQFNLKRRRKSGLARRKPVQKVFPQRGHKFTLTQFYQIVKCATCGEFLMRGLGYQCQACKFACHKACHTRVMAKCITKSEAELSKDEASASNALLKHNVPHRFEPHTMISPTWCAHCGFMLPFGKKKATMQCSECKLCAHVECAPLIPNFCGLSYELMGHLLSALEKAETEKKQRLFLKERREAEAEQIRIRFIEEEKRRAAAMQAQETLLQQNLGAAAVSETPKPGVAAPVAKLETTTAVTSDGSGVLVEQRLVQVAPSQPSVSLDDFHMLAVLGKGNFGKVMLVEDKQTHQLFAIKVLKKSFVIENDEVESTKSEKRVFLTATKARHPFLVNLHSCFQSDSRIFFVMEYVSGGDLMWHIQHQQFTERRAKFYACEVLLALEYFHRCGIVYRDLKLDNILLSLEGHVKIADYGLCKENMHYGATTNTFCGTPEFMAPEILIEKPYTRAVDWWAFGVLVYEMLLGQSPFKGDDEDEIFEAILNDEISYPAHLNRDAVDLVRRLLCKDPARRLGAGQLDAEEIKRHPYFRGTDWDALLQLRVPPPFFPSIKSATDVSNFDQEFTREKPVLTPLHSVLSQADQDEFKEFSFVSEWAQSLRNMPSAQPDPIAVKIEQRRQSLGQGLSQTRQIAAQLSQEIVSVEPVAENACNSPHKEQSKLSTVEALSTNIIEPTPSADSASAGASDMTSSQPQQPVPPPRTVKNAPVPERPMQFAPPHPHMVHPVQMVPGAYPTMPGNGAPQLLHAVPPPGFVPAQPVPHLTPEQFAALHLQQQHQMMVLQQMYQQHGLVPAHSPMRGIPVMAPPQYVPHPSQFVQVPVPQPTHSVPDFGNSPRTDLDNSSPNSSENPPVTLIDSPSDQ